MSNPEYSMSRQSPVPLSECGAARALEQLPDRWTWLILRELLYRVGRFADMQAELGIPKSVLAGRLSQIVDKGLARKVAYRDGAARTRHAYALTGKGRDLALVVLALMQWGDTHLKKGETALALTNKHTGEPVEIGIVRKGDALPLQDLNHTPVWEKSAGGD